MKLTRLEYLWSFVISFLFLSLYLSLCLSLPLSSGNVWSCVWSPPQWGDPSMSLAIVLSAWQRTTQRPPLHTLLQNISAHLNKPVLSSISGSQYHTLYPWHDDSITLVYTCMQNLRTYHHVCFLMKGLMEFWEDGPQIELAICGSASYFQNNFCAVQQGKTSFLKSIAQQIA